jgi:rhodanese-related sulfurtransferase
VFRRPPIPVVHVRELGENVYLLDVREDDEWVAGHAPDAVHLPMTELPGRLDEIPAEGDVVVVCRSGHRSAEVTGYLLGQGFTNVRNLAEGMIGWAAAGRPLVSEDGDTPSVI